MTPELEIETEVVKVDVAAGSKPRKNIESINIATMIK